jgi:hypothetical protein
MRARARTPNTIVTVASPTRRSQELTAGEVVGWIIIASLMFWPRLFLLGFWIFDRQIGKAFDTGFVPVAGFFLLPWTTLTYAIMWGLQSDRVSGVEWAAVAFAFLVDLYTWAGVRR